MMQATILAYFVDMKLKNGALMEQAQKKFYKTRVSTYNS